MRIRMRDIPGFDPELLKSRRAWVRWMKKHCLWTDSFFGNIEPRMFPCIGFTWLDSWEELNSSYIYAGDLEKMMDALKEASDE